jgi:hypothetical protein
VRSRRYFSLYLQEGGVVLFFLLTNKGVDRDYQRPSFCCLRGGSDYGDKTGNRTGFCHGSFFPTFWMSGSTCYGFELVL